MANILVIDDDESVRDVLSMYFSEEGYTVTTAVDGQEGVDLVKAGKFDIIFLDLIMPAKGGLDVLKDLSDMHSRIPAIVMTAFATVKTAVDAMRLGAFDYVTKPFILEELLILVHRALSISKLRQENVMLRKQLRHKYDFHRLIGDSPQMEKVYDLIEKIADTESTVLISGESGTGKEVVAKTIHYNSSRSQEAFVPLNCGAIPRELLESELFGHEKGAFTGAVNMRVGRFELASGGTIFLDEIGELHPSLQVKLLRVLQEREFERVGGMKTVKVDVRILAATNKDLEQETKAGAFREDLYYRLSVIPLHIPPLRERKEDIPLLMDHFVNNFARKKKKEALKVAPRAMACLKVYPWPGNVRELENLVERMVILDEDGIIDLDDLPERFHSLQRGGGACSGRGKMLSDESGEFTLTDEGIDLNEVIDRIERGLILQALEKSGGVKKKAAELLGLNRTTLLEKLKKKGIETPGKDVTTS
ncbi:MAG: sigma-54 dependent transcriptional regulator [Nitrospiraceae bacterium]|nr:sigma-54 dependent transcriptional regulator [Nitrospiraceae bacterium]